MIEFRCKNCNHLLFKELVLEGEVEIKCPYCKAFISFRRKVKYQPTPVDMDKKKGDNK